MRIVTSQSERWLIKAAEWNPELSSKYRTNRAIGRPRKRWEDDINEFLEETENFTESSNQINKTWINTAKDRRRWTLLEENYTMTSEERHENNTRMRRNSHNIPARYVNGVKLSNEESHNANEKKIKEIKSKNEDVFLESRNSSAISSACITQRSFGNQQQIRSQEHYDGWSLKSNVMGGHSRTT